MHGREYEVNPKVNLKGFFIVCVLLLFSGIIINFPYIEREFKNVTTKINEAKYFKIISSTANKPFDDELIKFGKKNRINIKIDHYGDLEIVDILNSENNYDAVWISNSIWLYMLNNSYAVANSKSIGINPVVMGIKKSKAESLGFVNKDIYNKDILKAIKDGNLKYVMSSVTSTNTGATAYLGFLNSLAGSPEVLSLEMLDDQTLLTDLKSLFTGIERVSGDDNYLVEMFKKSNYDAMINYESALINLNLELEAEGKEPLYLLYPTDGVAINDMPFAYVERNQGKEKNFEKIQQFLLSDDTKTSLENKGVRTWYGGINNEASSVFNKNWGINTNEYLIPLKYPSKLVMTKAIDVYIEKLRKPNHTVFCLDFSGSMRGSGEAELKDAMNYILNYEEAKKDQLQFSDEDKVTIVFFNSSVSSITETKIGDDIETLISTIKEKSSTGGTNIYDSSIVALETLNKEDDTYTKTVVLMTDGESNNGDFDDLERYYYLNDLDIPIYSITFGDSNENQLKQIANLTNSKIFDGKSGLKNAFKEVRSYN